MPYWYGDERCILESRLERRSGHSGLSPAPVRWVLVRDPRGCAIRKLSYAPVSTRRRSRFSDGSSIVGRSKRRFRKAARILASRRNGNGPISPSHGRRRRCLGCFRSLRFGRPIPKSRQPSPEIGRVVSQTRTFLQRRHGRRSKALLERAEFINVPHGRMAWKFQPPSWKDSRKRSATRHKIRKVELRMCSQFLVASISLFNAPAKGLSCTSKFGGGGGGMLLIALAKLVPSFLTE